MFFVIYLEGHQNTEEYFRTLEVAYETFMQHAEIPSFLQVPFEQLEQELADTGALDFEMNEWHFETRFFEEDICGEVE